MITNSGGTVLFNGTDTRTAGGASTINGRPYMFNLRGHVMEGWERVEVASVTGAGVRLRFLAQTPSERIKANVVVDISSHHQRGHFLVWGPSPAPQEMPLPEMGSGISGWHHNIPAGPSRRWAVTPGLAETDYHCDEQLLV